MVRRFRLAAFGAIVSAGGLCAMALSASAQNIFCPPNANPNNTTLGGVPANFALSAGSCTNGTTGSGAFSGAALASQALSDLTQSTTTQINRNTSNAVANRRAEEAARCPAGQIRTASGCAMPNLAPRAAAPRAAAKVQMRKTKIVMMKKGKKIVRTVMRPVEPMMAPPPPGPAFGLFPQPLPILIEAPRYGAFVQGFGDYERRTGTGGSAIFYDAGAGGIIGGANFAPGINSLPFIIQQEAKTRTAGMIGGVDVTFRNNFVPGDGIIIGALGGYTDTTVNITTRTIPLTNLLPFGGSKTNVTVRGPSAGVYGTYFAGPFSMDHTLKMDFFKLNESFLEAAAFSGASGPLIANIFGSGSTSVTQVSSIFNANYRFPFWTGVFLEPTVGYQYTASFYGGGAEALGLRNGDLLRLQGGLRLGYEGLFGISRLTATLTGLAYENVFVNGGFLPSGSFGSSISTLSDARKLRGEGLLNVVYDFGNGLSAFVQTDVRGGRNYVGVGGKGGFRYQW